MTPRFTTETPAPVITTTELVWRGDQRFDAGPEARTHRIDASRGDSPGPVETLLNAVGACSSVDVLEILAKRRTPVERLVVKVTADRQTQPPRRVRRLEIDYRIDGAGIEREHAERAIQL